MSSEKKFIVEGIEIDSEQTYKQYEQNARFNTVDYMKRAMDNLIEAFTDMSTGKLDKEGGHDILISKLKDAQSVHLQNAIVNLEKHKELVEANNFGKGAN